MTIKNKVQSTFFPIYRLNIIMYNGKVFYFYVIILKIPHLIFTRKEVMILFCIHKSFEGI